MTRYEVEVNISAKNRASAEFKKLDNDIKRVRSKAKDTATGFDAFSNSVNDVSNRIGGFTSTLGTLAGAFGAVEVLRLGVEMAQTGEQIANITNRFEDLVGGSQKAASALETLRTATNGMVTDTGLMAGASRLLQMGIAQSVDEAAKLVEIAIALKQPSEDAATAIENLSLMIANTSYLRLDSLGLSAGRVRQRVNELRDAGMELQEAFTQAFIEEAAGAMDTLASSTNDAVTAMNLLSVASSNAMTGVYAIAADMGNSFAMLGLALSGNTDALTTLSNIRLDQIGARLIENADYISQNIELADRASDSIQDYLSYQSGGLFGTGLFQGDVDPAIIEFWDTVLEGFETESLQDYRDFAQILQVIIDTINEGGDIEALDFSPSMESERSNMEEFRANAAERRALRDEEERQIASQQRRLGNINFIEAEMALERRREQERQQHIETTYRAQERFYRLQTASAEREMRSFAFSTVREFGALDDQFKRIYERGVINEDFYSPRNLDALSRVVDRYDTVLARAESLAEDGLISDTDLRSFRESANDATRLLRTAESQARAFQNVNLSTLLGEVSGGATTELGFQVSIDFVEEQMADEFTKALERLTGERTVLTDYMEDSLVPLIQSVTEAFGPDEGALFAYNLRSAMQAGLEAGLSPEEVKQMIQNTLGFDYAFDQPMTVTVPAMVTWSNVIADGRPTVIDPETGEELDDDGFLRLVEERLDLEEGTITADPDKAIKYSLANTDITITDVANATGMAEEQLAGLFFNDPNNRTVDMTQPLSVNLHSVGWGQVLDATGLTTQALLAQLPDEAVDIINGQIFIRPGTYEVAPLTPIRPGAGGTIPGMVQQGYEMAQPVDPLTQTATNAMTQLGQLQTYWSQMATSATTVQQKSAETNFSAMETGMEQVANHSEDAYSNLTKLVETEWVATVALDFVILDSTKWGQLPGFTNAVRDIVESSTRDNGGVTPGSSSRRGPLG